MTDAKFKCLPGLAFWIYRFLFEYNTLFATPSISIRTSNLQMFFPFRGLFNESDHSLSHTSIIRMENIQSVAENLQTTCSSLYDTACIMFVRIHIVIHYCQQKGWSIIGSGNAKTCVVLLAFAIHLRLFCHNLPMYVSIFYIQVTDDVRIVYATAHP